MTDNKYRMMSRDKLERECEHTMKIAVKQRQEIKQLKQEIERLKKQLDDFAGVVVDDIKRNFDKP